MDLKIRALNRFGLGARIGERDSDADPRAWLRRQVERGSQTIHGPELEVVAKTLIDLREAQRSQDRSRLMQVNRAINDIQRGEVAAMLTQRVTTDAPFVERLVGFWSNHLCVSAMAKRQVSALAGHYERTVIRPHVLGRFSDMVMASAKHPAMLYYLDNLQSVGPGSQAGTQTARRGRARGLNENYARELMELHTLGVDGGYTQEDVEQLARILTGWTVAGVGPGTRPGEQIGFTFRPVTHEPGTKTLLGRQYRRAGVREGEQAIRDLCAHPATAAFVAEKLVQHFVADVPPMGAVARIARVFQETEGDLREVSMALIDLDEAWSPEHRKFRTPQDWLVAVFRAVHGRQAPQQMAQFLRQLRHTPWAPSAPKGYGDTKREWADPDSLMNRAELARTLAGQMAGRGDLDPRRLLDVVDIADGDPLRTLLADRSIPVPERMALAVGGPRLSVEVIMHRRTFVRGMCYGGLATFALPVARFAQVPGDGRMVFVLLRGGFDGLSALVPVGDPDYASVRDRMAYGRDDLTMIGDDFGLAPGLSSWKSLWDDDELVALHAMAIPFRTRSHFAGQAILETGLARPDGSSDGWLNRLLQIMDGERSGIAVAAGMPRSLSGTHPVTTWSPAELGVVDDSYVERLTMLYRSDPELHDPFEAALQMKDIAPDMGNGGMGGRRARPGRITPIMQAAAKFLREPGGPNVAALEFSGWDTHANQGLAGGQLDRLLGQLSEGVLALRREMQDDWANTTVVIMTEFGRTARPNGTQGTDHGTAGAGFIIGPNVAKSAVISDWPGLSERSLYESRDLKPTLDTRSVLKGVVAGVFDLTAGQADRVFPGSADARGLWDLMR